jgi:hypothetical protein
MQATGSRRARAARAGIASTAETPLAFVPCRLPCRRLVSAQPA